MRGWPDDNIKNNIARMISGSEYGSPEAMVGASLMMMHMVTAMFGGLHTAVGTESGGASAMTTFITMSGVGQGAPAVVAGSLLLLNQIAISLCILTAPAFILCLLYEPTKQYFQGWLKFFLGALLTLGVLSVMVTIALKVVLVYNMSIYTKYMVSNLFSDVGGGVAQTTIMQGGLGLLMSALMIMAPSLAGQLFGSTLGFSPYSPWGNAGARDASGAPVGSHGNHQVSQQSSSTDQSKVEIKSDPNSNSQALMAKQQAINNANTVKRAGESQHGVAP